MKWFVAILVVLLAALVLESGLLAYAMYVLLGLLILSRLLARNWINHLQATRALRRKRSAQGNLATDPSVDMEVEIGEKVRVRVVLRNRGWLPVPWVLVEDLLPTVALSKRFQRLKVKGKRLQILMLRGGGEGTLSYEVECLKRGYYQIGPLMMESGDLFGLHRRHRVETEPLFVLVLPPVVPLAGYDLASRRPIGDVRMTHRLYEDPTRIAGVRSYQPGDPQNRVHWRATARTGQLHSKVYEPSTLTGATILLDFHQEGYTQRGEPFRSELAITTVASLANAICEMGQQVGFVTNARDAADRIRTSGWQHEQANRVTARASSEMQEKSDRLAPLIVPTRRGVEQLHHIREVLARAELTDGLPFAQLLEEVVARLPRDATVIAVFSDVTVETALALGNLRRQGFAVTAVLIIFEDRQLERGMGRLWAEGIRDVRHLPNEAGLPELCSKQAQGPLFNLY